MVPMHVSYEYDAFLVEPQSGLVDGTLATLTAIKKHENIFVSDSDARHAAFFGGDCGRRTQEMDLEIYQLPSPQDADCPSEISVHVEKMLF